jgi:hypothetical protein
MNIKKDDGGFLGKFKKIIGFGQKDSNESIEMKKTFTKSEVKKPEIKPTKEIQKAKENKLLNDDDSEENEEGESGIRVGKSPELNKKQQENEGKPAFVDENSKSGSSLTEKFAKKGLGPKKSLKEIADEAQKKKEETANKAFSESDAAQKDLKKKDGFEKIIKKKTLKALEGKVFLVRGKDNGRPAWHYVLVSKESEAELKKQKAGTNIDVADYGKIIKSGWGEEPSDEVKREIEEEYGS